MKNIRFIKTKISDDSAYVIMTKCDYCPYFAKDKYTAKTRCGRSYNSPNKDNVISDNVRFMIRNNNLVVDGETLIPDWCVLPDKMKDEMDNRLIRYKSRGFIYEFLSFFQKGIDKIVPDVYIRHKYESDELEYNVEGKLYLERQIKIKESELPAIIQVSSVGGTPKEYTPFTEVVKKEENICSCCGEDKEEVKRDVNDGMCDDCFETNKFNDALKYYSYINNFRLKRKSNWSKDDFKIISK